jgi:hypothetical protein
MTDKELETLSDLTLEDLLGPRMTDEELLNLLNCDDSPFNKARKEFSSSCARIEQASNQRTPLSPIEIRIMEFEAVQRIVKCLGIDISLHQLTWTLPNWTLL